LKEINYLFELIKSVINKTETIEFDKDLDWDEIFKISNAHDLAHLVCYALDNMPKKPTNYNEFSRVRNIAIMRDAKQEYEAGKLFNALEKENIDYIPLKGYILKKLYPTPDMRTMSDIDILVNTSNFEKTKESIKSIMTQQGFELERERNYELCYKKLPAICVEFSDSLVGEVQKKYASYFDGYWKRLKKVSKNQYEQSDEDYFIYHLVHMSKHYSMYGTGIRSFLDICVYLQHKGDSLDWEYLNNELEKLEMKKFCDNSIRLSRCMFAEAEADEVIAEMMDYVINSGIYGTEENKNATMSIKDGKVKNDFYVKIKRYFFAIFPTYKTMTNLYPELRKCPLLYPVYWVIRWVNKIFINKKAIKNFVDEGKDIDSLKARKHNEHMKKVGL